MRQGLRRASIAALLMVACAGGEGSSSSERGAPRPSPLLAENGATVLSGRMEGVVVEAIQAKGYTYLLVDDGSLEQQWAAILGHGVEPGERVSVVRLALHEDFHSSSLDRDFDRLVMGILVSSSS